MEAFHDNAIRGSSPRMRGAQVQGGIALVATGIIPAYAGSTTDSNGSMRRSTDHPRVCGEHPCGYLLLMSLAGSSPRMRGAPALSGLGRDQSRIIPAYAGSTRFP